MKKSLRTILFLIIFASIGTFIAYKFDLLEKIINKDSVNGKIPITIYVDKPKVKIIDVNSTSDQLLYQLIIIMQLGHKQDFKMPTCLMNLSQRVV